MMLSKTVALRVVHGHLGQWMRRTLSSSCPLRAAAVFDRRAKLLQRERAAADPSVDDYDFLKEEIGYRVSDRVLDVARKLPVLVDIGSGRGWVTRHLTEHQIEKVIAIEMSEGLLSSSPDLEEGVDYERLVLDEDTAELPIPDNSVDVVTSCLSLHWVNNLPEVFAEINRILKPDGVFIGAMFGGDTLVELRVALQLAEMERQGGFTPRVSPFVEVRDLGALLNGAKFTMLTIDTDDMKVRYASLFPLMRDLKGMAENNASINRQVHVRRENLLAANAIYSELYGDEEGSLPATFHIFYWIGWKPDPSQPKALQPQKSDISLKDLHRLDEIAEKRGVYDAEPEEPKNK